MMFSSLSPHTSNSSGNIAYAQSQCGSGGMEECNFGALIGIVDNIYSFLLTLATYVFVIAIIIIGVLLLFSSDSTKSRTILTGNLKKVLVGYVLLLSAGYIFSLIFHFLVDDENQDLNKFDEFII